MTTNLEKTIGYNFKNGALLEKALGHSSMKRFAVQFERLEFLGDRILGLVIAEYIYRNFKEAEGAMAKMLASFVCADSCYRVALKIGLDDEIITAGEHLKKNRTVLSDAMEAVLGAIFLDGGYGATKLVILNLWEEIFRDYDENIVDPKTKLQEISQAKFGKTPEYELISVSGEDHRQEFTVRASVGKSSVMAVGKSRKDAEIKAASKLLLENKTFGAPY
ncbi:MAG: ribonuclease III [Holosporales bacterium]|nr:ribonuclease III [Holosporales bacterium]